MPALIRALDDPDTGVRLTAAQALAEFGPRAGAAREKLPALLALDDGYSPDESESPVWGEPLHRPFLAIGPSAVGTLLPSLRLEAWTARYGAARILGRLSWQARATVPDLLRLREDPDSRVRVAAAEALWRIAREIDPAGSALADDIRSDDEWVRWRAGRVSRDAGRRASLAVPALVDALSDEDEDVRRAVIDALADIGPASGDAGPALARLVREGNANDRSFALVALVKIGPRAMPFLVEVLERGEDDRVKAVLLELLYHEHGVARPESGLAALLLPQVREILSRGSNNGARPPPTKAPAHHRRGGVC